MNYRYKDFEFSTELEFYRIVAADIPSPYYRERDGLCTIYYPISLGGVSRITTAFQQIFVRYCQQVYRLKTVDPVSLTVVEITDLGDTVYVKDSESLKLISDSITEELIKRKFLDSGLFELWGLPDNRKFEYKEVINYPINRTTDFTGVSLPTSPIKLEDTRDRYVMDQAHAIYALYDALDIELKKQKFYLKNLYETEDLRTRLIATLQFDSYAENYDRLHGSWNNDIASYVIPMKLILNIPSVSKFERLLADINSLKYITNIVRVYAYDRFHNVWVSNIKWNTDLNTNSPRKAENDNNEVSYFIELDFEYEFCILRDARYNPIRTILLNVISR